MNNVCEICGLTDDEHHAFVPAVGTSRVGGEIPAACVCDPNTWAGGEMSPICGSYDGNGVQYCKTCEHDAACHTTAMETPR